MNTFTPAQSTDRELLRDLNYKIYSEIPSFDPHFINEFIHSDAGTQFIQSAINPEGGICLILREDGVAVGYTNGCEKMVPYRKGRCFEIENLGVLPEFKGKGYGKMLLNEITTWAREHSYERIYLSCYAKNAEALGFYRKQGFSDLDIGLEKEI